MNPDSEFDLVVYGASGFTGRLVAEYLAERYGAGGEVKWAMAGRDAAKLAAVRDEIGAPADTPLIQANAEDPASLRGLVAATRAVITTVGPYQLYGEPLVAACAESGTDYLDLCGEPAWMRQMIDRYEAQAKPSGARIVFSCGFDSIPFELGVFFMEEEAVRRHGQPAPRVKSRVRSMKGGFSGGTAASLDATLAAARKDPGILALLLDHFSLTPGFKGPDQPPANRPEHDEHLGVWTAPFVMATINTRNVHRSNALMGHPWGQDLVYDEMIITGSGEQGQAMAEKMAAHHGKELTRPDGPKPGEGPSKEERETGFFDVLVVGAFPDGRQVRASVKGDKDPGYGSTSKMIAESGVCLVKDAADVPGGIWTPGAAMGNRLIKRLQDNAGLTFAVEEA